MQHWPPPLVPAAIHEVAAVTAAANQTVAKDVENLPKGSTAAHNVALRSAEMAILLYDFNHGLGPADGEDEMIPFGPGDHAERRAGRVFPRQHGPRHQRSRLG
jgi:hypothetical protein